MERIYRDPVHNIIALFERRPDDALIVRLIDTPEFQRLRHIKQLGLAMYTYQGAEHSRFTHSLGVMHLMTRVLDQLRKRYTISDEAYITARVAAMLHDIGHGPFSHSIESVLDTHHETWTKRIILEPSTTIHQILANFDSALPDRVAAAIDHKYKPSFIGQLVSSQLDVDRFDYLLRDSLMTGAKYGNYDLEWIIHSLEIDDENDRIYISSNGLFAVEEYLQARYYMFRQVYFHKSLRSAEGMMIGILRRAVELMRAQKLHFIIKSSVMESVLLKKELSVSEYLQFDDHDVMFHIKQWTREPDLILSDLSRRFIERKLFKAIDLQLDENDRSTFVEQATKRISSLGFDPRYYLIEDKTSDVPYYNYYHPDGKTRLFIKYNGKMCDIAEVSVVLREMRGYELHRLCFPAEAVSNLRIEH